jgi:hypothetical protein
MSRFAERALVVLAGLVVLGVFTQVYLIASYLFGADTLSTHEDVGFYVHGFEILTLVAALLARRERLLALGLAVIGTAQIALASSDKYVGGLHGLFATFVLLLAAAILWRGRIAART